MDDAIVCAEKEIRRTGAKAGEIRLVITTNMLSQNHIHNKEGAFLTVSTDELSSGSLIGETSKKLNAFHCAQFVSMFLKSLHRPFQYLLMSEPFGCGPRHGPVTKRGV